jgi:carbonic anhydrase/acetyltransferase-like protein (isoleucine patch superfamily)
MTWDSGIRVSVDGKTPKVAASAFIAPTAVLIGDVIVEEDASIWFGAVLRGDEAPIRIGARSNVQDNVAIHVGPGRGTVVEEDVSIGHSAVVHNCVVRRGAVIGMRACIQDNAEIGERVMVAAGAVVREGFIVPDDHTVAGVPARLLGPNSERSKHFLDVSAPAYVKLSAFYRRTATVTAGGEES